MFRRTPSPHSHHHRYKDPLIGRLWVIGVFVLLRAVDVILLLNAAPSNQKVVTALVVTSTMWSAALLAGVWLRHLWARYTLIGLLSVCLLVSLVLLPEMSSHAEGIRFSFIFWMLGNLAAVLLLVFVQPLKDLTDPTYLS